VRFLGESNGAGLKGVALSVARCSDGGLELVPMRGFQILLTPVIKRYPVTRSIAE
jgi:hypothetical protein